MGKGFFSTAECPCRKSVEAGQVIYGNEYIAWSHDEKTGQLTGAFVKNGSNTNLMPGALYFSVCRKEEGALKTYHTGKEAFKVQFKESAVLTEMPLIAPDGARLEGVTVRHSIEYGTLGEAVHTLELLLEKPLTEVVAMLPVRFAVNSAIDQLGIRRRLKNGQGGWSQNPMEWKKLHGGRRAGDCIPELSCSLPLSMMFLDSGTEALQWEICDEFSTWEFAPDYQESAVLFNRETGCYDVRFSTHCDREGDRISHCPPLKFRFSLPFVKKQIVPLRRATSLLYFVRGFEKRWPTEEDVKQMRAAGVDLLRLHCDGDSFKNGIYWRSTVYPPFPAEEMEKMNDFLELAHRYDIHVVPYFSVKEFHFEAPDYAENYEKWGKRSWQDARIRTNGTFGSVMCLRSPWKEKRQSAISQVLGKHDFDGIYYDWCGGLECDNRAHGTAPHWDNDVLLEHIKWTIDTFKDQKERYLHLTFVSSLAVENAATMVITEETVFPQLGPEMFSPHVHFLNVAPRQICNMLKNSTPAEKRKLAMAALLHHATVSSNQEEFLQFYASLEWLDEVGKFTRHTAPGEGLAGSSDAETGVSVYWNDEEALIVCANFSEESRKSSIWLDLPGKPGMEEEVILQGLEVKVLRCRLMVEALS